MALSGVIPRAGSGMTGPVEIVVVCIVAFILHSHAPTLYHSWLTWQPGFGRKLSPGRVRVVARGPTWRIADFQSAASRPLGRARERGRPAGWEHCDAAGRKLSLFRYGYRRALKC